LTHTDPVRIKTTTHTHTHAHAHTRTRTQVIEEEGDELNDIVSAPRMVISQFIRHHLPISRDVNLSENQLNSLVVQVYRFIREWEKLPPFEEQAARAVREEEEALALLVKQERRQAAAEKRTAERDAAAAARDDKAGPSGSGSAAAAGAGEQEGGAAAAADAAEGEGEDDNDEDDVEIVGEADLDQVLQVSLWAGVRGVHWQRWWMMRAALSAAAGVRFHPRSSPRPTPPPPTTAPPPLHPPTHPQTPPQERRAAAVTRGDFLDLTIELDINAAADRGEVERVMAELEEKEREEVAQREAAAAAREKTRCEADLVGAWVGRVGGGGGGRSRQ